MKGAGTGAYKLQWAGPLTAALACTFDKSLTTDDECCAARTPCKSKGNQNLKIRRQIPQVPPPLPSLHPFFSPIRAASTITDPQDSLGGNSKTLMVATLRASKDFHAQSTMSLLYASRARAIR